MRTIQKTGVGWLVAAVVFVAGMSFTVSGQSNALGERFSAIAMDMDRGTTTQLQIVVDRWSSEMQSKRLNTILSESGPEKLLEALQDAPKVGYIRTSTSLAWDLHYARRTAGEDGGERIVLATDRPIAFWEAASQSRTLDYPFTVIELRVNPDGEGQGMLSIAAKLTKDKRDGSVTIENWGTQPVRLTQVKAERMTQ